MRPTSLLLALLVVALQACASVPPVQPPAPPVGPPTTAAERFFDADGFRVGTVDELADDVMVLIPFETGSGPEVLRLKGPLPVWYGGGEQGSEMLYAGASVRAFFMREKCGPPRVIGVELISRRIAGAAAPTALHDH